MANQRRKIIHVDMDAFYASVEQRDYPEYRGKPLVVGSSPQKRGVVAAASYEAYLDVTENKQKIIYASTIGRHIRAAIFEETGLTASAGVSFNKFLAKMASGLNKPNGLSVILPEDAEAFVEALPVEKFHGIGEVTAAKMHELGIRTGSDLKLRTARSAKPSLAELTQNFGKAGNYYYKIARGKDDRPVEPNRIRKSIGAEMSFAEDLRSRVSMLLELEQIAQTLKQRLDRHQASGRTLTLKVKFSDYQQITRSRTESAAIIELKEIMTITKALFEAIKLEDRGVRLLGIALSNLDNSEKAQLIQLSLF